VEASEHAEGENVIDYSETLKKALPAEIEVAFLHGRMRSDMKNKIMEDFAANKIQVLVSTTVVEVGVNVPNATVMMIEDAQRFGLAQLHQLRGRVGRGDAQSYCIMINTSDSKESGRRLDVLNKTNDGFKIASEDLKLRGPGDFFGIRQSGDMEFQLADIYQDAVLLQEASKEAARILALDNRLELPAHAGLRERLRQYFDRQPERLNL
ncbi:MAG: DNA helicase RecG, partial [Eubacterium sp.]|nr:DNA helicase RecG [Eubacterium sp.]